jgi:glycosyltransferase involved in cell wall biosynthesis
MPETTKRICEGSQVKPPTTNYQLPTTKSVALVTDWIYGGGSELVVEAFHEIFPEAPIYTSYCSDEWRKRLDNKVVTGYLQKAPFRQLRKFLPLLRQWWFTRLDLSKYDLVISITGNGEAKFVRAKKHISYCHTPVHYYWRHYEQYLKNPGVKPAWLARLGLRLLVRPLRKRDYQAAQKVDVFIANSSHIKNDIKLYYDRESTVVFPPVDVEKFDKPFVKALDKSTLSFVTHGRVVPAKRIDILIKACNQLRIPLTIIGKGPDLARLRTLSGPTINFGGFVTDEALASELQKHSAFLFASYEDFGIAPIEAMAAGLPVVAYRGGGALDYVVPGETGEFFDQQTVESLIERLRVFDPDIYNRKDLNKKSREFTIENFNKSITGLLHKV